MRNSWGGLELFPVLVLAALFWGVSHSHIHQDVSNAASGLVSAALEGTLIEADQIDLEARANVEFADAVGKAVSAKIQSISFELRFDRLDAFELLAFVFCGFLSWLHPRRTRLLGAMAGASLIAGEAWQFLMGAERISALELLTVAAGALVIGMVGMQVARLSPRR